MKKILAAFGIAVVGLIVFSLLLTFMAFFPTAFFLVTVLAFGTWFAYGWIDECTNWFR
jgi:hypothetical protein